MGRKKMTIRDAAIGDVGDINILSKELGYESSAEDTGIRLEYLLRKPLHRILVAEIDGRAVGYISFEHYEIVYYESGINITALVVKAEHRKKGIGKLLLDAAEDYARENGLAYVRLNSGSQRVEAHEFYRNNGYDSEKDQKRFVKNLK